METSIPNPTNKRNRSLQFIANNNARNASWKKRIQTLKLKAHQLSTLADVSVSVLCFAPDGKLHTWPENPTEVKQIVMNYKNCVDRDARQGKWSENVDLSSFLETKKRKIQEEKSEIDGAKEAESCTSEQSLDELPKSELMNLMGRLDFTLQRLRERRDQLLLDKNNVPLPSDNFAVPGFNDNVGSLQGFGSENQKINNGGSSNFLPGYEMFDYQSMLIPQFQVVPDHQLMLIPPFQVVCSDLAMLMPSFQEALPLSR
ncbi:floral homeotic protein AGAMOUS-like [Carica papaya]|uniref:floral homeotic protein AGAMOUS-like n=1 Tax=Carica papaya TaxID=3649 RepID=UPI000B8D12EC|nr:floral homeotic protein AGAMOUS-like [Carica papaya]